MEDLKLILKIIWGVLVGFGGAVTVGGLILGDVNILRVALPILVLGIPTLIVLNNKEK